MILHTDVECGKCGACCRTFPIFASAVDGEREERIQAAGLKVKPWLETPERCWQLHPLPFLSACPFLDETCMCRIYESRPEVCRRFEPGGEQCGEARRRVKKEPR